MKPFLIRFWHGEPDPHGCFAKKIKMLCKQDEQNNLYWDGTLDTFALHWGEKFIYFPAKDREKEYITGNIFVTPYDHFGP